MRFAWFALAALSCTSDWPPILTYHRIADDPGDPRAVPAPELEAQLDALSARGLRAISLAEAFRAVQSGRPIPDSVVLTFDDGTIDHYTEAFPRLAARKMPGVFFVSSDLLDMPGYLGAAQLREMAAAGMEIGGHGRRHLRGAELDEARHRGEIFGSRERLAEILGRPPEFMAFPFNSPGDGGPRLAREAGWRGALAGSHGTSDPYRLHRLALWRGAGVPGLIELLR